MKHYLIVILGLIIMLWAGFTGYLLFYRWNKLSELSAASYTRGWQEGQKSLFDNIVEEVKTNGSLNVPLDGQQIKLIKPAEVIPMETVKN